MTICSIIYNLRCNIIIYILTYIFTDTDIIINKCDVLEKIGVFKLIHEGSIQEYKNLNEMKDFIRLVLHANTNIESSVYSGDKEKITHEAYV